jgi:protocatechuate 3,4-dioxygenase beta subunit
LPPAPPAPSKTAPTLPPAAPGVVLYVYQTGVDGLYQGAGERVPRIRGYVKSDAQGRFRYRTIRPGSYPNSRIPAHIHTQLWGGGYEPQWNRDVNFVDDPYVSESEKRDSAAAGRFAWICDPKKDADGFLRCTHNLKLKPHGDHFEGNVRHGLDHPNG